MMPLHTYIIVSTEERAFLIPAQIIPKKEYKSLVLDQLSVLLLMNGPLELPGLGQHSALWWVGGANVYYISFVFGGKRNGASKE